MTPPFFGVNDRQIEGWHFRNQDNSGPNRPGVGNVNAPQHIRRFCFTLSAADYERALLWREARMASGPAAASDFDFATGTGILTITALTLGNLTPGERAWIEQMMFHAVIDISTPCPPI